MLQIFKDIRNIFLKILKILKSMDFTIYPHFCKRLFGKHFRLKMTYNESVRERLKLEKKGDN